VHRDSILLKRTNSMSQCADIYLLQRLTLHVSGVTAPILRSSKNCICYLWYRSWYWYRYIIPPWPEASSWSFLLIFYVSYIYIYIYGTTQPKLLFNEHNTFLIVSYYLWSAYSQTDNFLFPIFIIICLLLPLILPSCTQLSVLSHSP
jgi:hypothetical protein